MSDLERAMRAVLVELELTSVTRAHAYGAVVTSSSPDSAPPTGDASPASYWRDAYNSAAPAQHYSVLVAALDELALIRRRRFPLMAISDGDDLRERIVRDGEGLDAQEVATSLRCTPTMVRRTRLVAGREAETGRRVALITWDVHSLLAAGLSTRQVAAVTGTPRSTVHDHRHDAPP